MDELTDIYKRIKYLRNNGVTMKEIAVRVDMAPSVLSALYSSVLPAYIDLLKTRTPDEALDDALALANNGSKKRLLNLRLFLHISADDTKLVDLLPISKESSNWLIFAFFLNLATFLPISLYISSVLKSSNFLFIFSYITSVVQV